MLRVWMSGVGRGSDLNCNNINMLINGDCLEEIEKIKKDYIIVTDPPFNIGYHYKNYHDKREEGEYYEWLYEIFGNGAQVIVHYPESLHKYSYTAGLFPERIVSWVYNSNTAKQHRDIAFYNVKPDFRKVGQPYKNPKDKRIAKRISEGKSARLYDWWNINQVKNVSKTHSHPCEMPVKVMENIIGVLPDDITILDPFMGTGTTGVACKNTRRDFVGIELDKEYFNIAKKRINNSNTLNL